MARYGSIRSYEAALARVEREEKRRQRQLEKELKERAKLSEQRQAQLEVEESEARFSVLLSLHKDGAVLVDWDEFDREQPRPEATLVAHDALSYWRREMIHTPGSFTPQPDVIASVPSEADQNEAEAFRSRRDHTQTLARRILSGEEQACYEALAEFSILDELTELGIEIEYTYRGNWCFEVNLRLNDISVMPTETKSLTARGMLSVKKIPQARLNEMYQDHVCGAILRVAREMFAVLPIQLLLINAHTPLIDGYTGVPELVPVYSTLIQRRLIESLNFDRLDPSDTIDTFPHHGDFKATRKSGAFQRVEPMTMTDVSDGRRSISSYLTEVSKLRAELAPADAKNEEITSEEPEEQS